MEFKGSFDDDLNHNLNQACEAFADMKKRFYVTARKSGSRSEYVDRTWKQEVLEIISCLISEKQVCKNSLRFHSLIISNNWEKIRS